MRLQAETSNRIENDEKKTCLGTGEIYKNTSRRMLEIFFLARGKETLWCIADVKFERLLVGWATQRRSQFIGVELSPITIVIIITIIFMANNWLSKNYQHTHTNKIEDEICKKLMERCCLNIQFDRHHLRTAHILFQLF